MPMIVFAMKTCFFTRKDSYNLRCKVHMLHFFHLFHGKMRKVVYTMLAIAIEDLEVQLSNLN